MSSFYVTTAIPYVNGNPHLGHALELVQADVLARHRRLRGDRVRLLTGTDDHALKNVEAADLAGVPVREFVDAKARRFLELGAAVQLSNDDLIRTSSDPRHVPGVERLWRACAEAGDLYERDYEGLYCGGCEAFVAPEDLLGGHCAEHDRPPERVVERNWFFRLSRYRDRLLDVVASGVLRIEPEQRRNEVLAFLEGGLDDFSVSRPRSRARGWGIPVPGDPGQVVYVWFDALANYVTALDFGADGAACHEWWCGDGERVHVIGKGILRFHAVYWPAILLSAGQPLPTAIFVHGYLTARGRKLSKSLGDATSPVEVIDRYGVDALRWWLVRDVPRSGDADFRDAALAARANELADGLGNLVNRVIVLAGTDDLDGSGAPEAIALRRLTARLPATVDAALGRFDLPAAAKALWEVVVEANRVVSTTRPWALPQPARGAVLGDVLAALDVVAQELAPFLPAAASRVGAALRSRDAALGRSLFRKTAPGP